MRVTRRHLRKRNRTNKKFKRNTKTKYNRKNRKGGRPLLAEGYGVSYSFYNRNNEFEELNFDDDLYANYEDAKKVFRNKKIRGLMCMQIYNVERGQPLNVTLFRSNQYGTAQILKEAPLNCLSY